MRVLVDTNVLVSAWLSRGTCRELLLHCRRRHQVATCSYLMEEFRRALSLYFEAPDELVQSAVAMLRESSVLVEPVDVPPGATRDPADSPVLGAAVAGSCDCIVTGDKDLLVLQEYRGIPILSPRAFWKFEAEAGA